MKLTIFLLNCHLLSSLAVPDPGFPRRGGANPKGGAPTYYLAHFSRKQHENEEILGQRGEVRPSRPPYIRHCLVLGKSKSREWKQNSFNHLAVSLVDLRGCARNAYPLGPIVFIFMQFLGKIIGWRHTLRG